MTIERGWAIDFSDETTLGLEGASLAWILGRPEGRRDWDEARAEASRFVAPAAAWEAIPVAEVEADALVLAGGSRLSGSVIADVMRGADELVVGVCTVGPEISRRIREHQAERRLLRSVLLDDLGSVAVDMVRQQACERIAEEAAARGLNVSTQLSAGESQWPLADQAVLFSLVDAGRIGVSLSPSMLMTPLKSLSFVVGRGSRPLGRHGGSGCDVCTMRDRCTYRSRRSSAKAMPREGT